MFPPIFFGDSMNQSSRKSSPLMSSEQPRRTIFFDWHWKTRRWDSFHFVRSLRKQRWVFHCLLGCLTTSFQSDSKLFYSRNLYFENILFIKAFNYKESCNWKRKWICIGVHSLKLVLLFELEYSWNHIRKEEVTLILLKLKNLVRVK